MGGLDLITSAIAVFSGFVGSRPSSIQVPPVDGQFNFFGGGGEHGVGGWGGRKGSGRGS